MIRLLRRILGLDFFFALPLGIDFFFAAYTAPWREARERRATSSARWHRGIN